MEEKLSCRSAGFSTFGGGFVGVDIFFVISGYLITTIILKDLEAGTFSFWEFYERRARRILPALFFVMICCIPLAWIWMTPTELKAFASSVVAVSIFASNFLFWRQSGYFDQASEFKPLLHTWSLAVEEQFYIFFPVAMLILWRFGRKNVVASIALVGVLSLALSEYGSRYHPSFNFYWLPTRAWELAAGSLCAFAAIRPSAMRDNLLSVIGLATIIYSVLYYDERIRFPSLYSLLPVFGTCAIIVFAKNRTMVSSLLSSRVFVGFGLISYSIYLWHQPLFVFARIRSLTELSQLTMAGLVVVSLVLANLTWRFVETPFRSRKNLNRAKYFRFSAALSTALIAASGVTYYHVDMSAEKDGVEVLREGEKSWRECLNSGGTTRDDFIESPCIYSSSEALSKSSEILFGDSHAQVIHYDITKGLKIPAEVIMYAGGSCPPFYYQLNSRCALFHKQSAEFALNRFDIDTVVLSARWSVYLRSVEYVMKNGGRIESANPFGASEEDTVLVQKELEHLINFWLSKQIEVILVTDYPTNGRDIMQLYRRAIKFHSAIDSSLTTITLDEYSEWISPLTSVLKRFSGNPRFHLVDSYAALCGKVEACDLLAGNMPLLIDNNHASIAGRKLVGAAVANVINQIHSR